MSLSGPPREGSACGFTHPIPQWRVSTGKGMGTWKHHSEHSLLRDNRKWWKAVSSGFSPEQLYAPLGVAPKAEMPLRLCQSYASVYKHNQRGSRGSMGWPCDRPVSCRASISPLVNQWQSNKNGWVVVLFNFFQTFLFCLLVVRYSGSLIAQF